MTMTSAWSPGAVDLANEHFVLSSGDPFDRQHWTALARIGRDAIGHLFLEWLVESSDDEREEVESELRWLFVEKREVDPWAYARYHTSTAANLYSPIHWAFQSGEGR